MANTIQLAGQWYVLDVTYNDQDDGGKAERQIQSAVDRPFPWGVFGLQGVHLRESQSYYMQMEGIS